MKLILLALFTLLIVFSNQTIAAKQNPLLTLEEPLFKNFFENLGDHYLQCMQVWDGTKAKTLAKAKVIIPPTGRDAIPSEKQQWIKQQIKNYLQQCDMTVTTLLSCCHSKYGNRYYPKLYQITEKQLKDPKVAVRLKKVKS